MFGRGAIPCTECGGSGRCSECRGTGANCRLDDLEPRCRACNGASVCPACGGSGVESLPATLEISAYLRMVLTAAAGFILYEIFTGNLPVTVGRGGPHLPGVVGQVLAAGLGGPALYMIWKDVKRSDFRLPKERQVTSLFGEEEPKRKS